MIVWRPAAVLTDASIVWGFNSHRGELWPVMLATAVGMKDDRLKAAPEARLMVHALTGQGLYVEWWCERDPPAERTGIVEEKQSLLSSAARKSDTLARMRA